MSCLLATGRGRCGGRREVLALITEGTLVRAILECLGLPREVPVVYPARGPPEPELF